MCSTYNQISIDKGGKKDIIKAGIYKNAKIELVGELDVHPALTSLKERLSVGAAVKVNESSRIQAT